MLTATPGRKRAKVQQTFALNDGEVRVVDHLKAFRGICMVLTTYLPAMQDNDLVMLRVPSQHLNGEADVLNFKHIRMTDGEMKTALAIQIKEAKDE